MTLNLKSIKQQSVVVGDVDNVRCVLEKQRVSFIGYVICIIPNWIKYIICYL